MDADAGRCTRILDLLADPAGVRAAEHLQRCPDCTETLRQALEEPSQGVDLELRLLRAFRDWRAAGGGTG